MKRSGLFKLSLAALAVATSFTATAGISIIDNEQGSFSIGGDVEFDFNYQDNDQADTLNTENKDSNYNQTGRVLIEFAGERKTESGHYLAVKAQPLMDSNGEVNLDDAYFSFGKQGGWDLRMGRFEAYDMFPVGQDTFLEYSGDTANDLYRDGAGYVYQMKEARGRATSAGQLMYSQTFDNLYVELASVIGERADLFGTNTEGDGVTYHGREVISNKDAIVVRPVVAYQMGDFRIAGAIEANLVKDAVIDDAGNDLSDRIGYGITANYTVNDLSVNANVAYLDALNEKDTSVGLNVLWKGFGLGYIYGVNDFDAKSDFYDGKVKIDTFYASYEFANVLDVEDFSIYLGAFHTSLNEEGKRLNEGAMFSELDDKGARVRFKYFF
ncbi:carbohydrate porin [Photobacterium sp. BZF1]|uniref:carbohydrate porin n=1 Tax=Photobacterium sp. BZF1 TaxID=1904457 RepID=UPI001653DFD3|nr:carbohydrate porin [Photobacterium sp. BZF1]MBC7002374.1 carbohydrate porin [Photobacterium sp. BZF1]